MTFGGSKTIEGHAAQLSQIQDAIARLKRVPFVLEVRDLWPEAQQQFVPMLTGFALVSAGLLSACDGQQPVGSSPGSTLPYEHALFAGYVAVSHEDDTARDAFLSRQTHRVLNGREQLGSATATLLLEQANRLCDVLLIRLQRVRREHGRVAGKQHHVEQVSRL